jgi:thiol-disulfide isomerase/thioredoxin
MVDRTMTPDPRRTLLITALLVLGVGLMFWSESRRGRIPEGTILPDATLHLLDGGTLRLADTRGTPLVLDFWASWCGPCLRGLPHIDALARDLDSTARVVAVNADSEPVDSQRRVRDELHLSLPIAVDGASLAAALHIETLPTTVVVDAMGHVSETFVGAAPEAAIRRAVEKVR